MEHHTELTGYIGCGDQQKVIDGIVTICEREGFRDVELAPLPPVKPTTSRQNLCSVAVLPGAVGWHVVVSVPGDFFCRRTLNDGPSRFIALCDELQAPGVFHEVEGGDPDAGTGIVTLEADGMGNHALRGYMWRPEYNPDLKLQYDVADWEKYGKPDEEEDEKVFHWYGYRLDKSKTDLDLELIVGALPPEPERNKLSLGWGEIGEADYCGQLAYRLGGPQTAHFWEVQRPWRKVYKALNLGEPMPVPGGVILTFAKPGADQPL